MAAEPSSLLADRTAGALDGLASVQLDQLDPEQLAVGLAAVGDGIRLAVVMPDGLRAQLRALQAPQLLAAVASTAALPPSWAIPARVSPSLDEDPGLAWALRQRDEIESVLVAARATLAPRRVWVDTTVEAAKVRAATESVDLTCGGEVTRSLADALLGERVAIASGASWLEGAGWAEERDDAPASPAFERQIALATRPSAQALEAYVVRGHLGPWIEAAARRSSEIADELAEAIDTARKHGAAVSFVARLWEQARRRQATGELSAPQIIHVGRPSMLTTLAAADSAGLPPAATVEHRLGRLAPLDAEAVLHVTGVEATLEIFEGDRPLTHVAFGGVVATRSQGGHRWAVTLPCSAMPATLLATDASGRFEAAIGLDESS